jgi:hypothetical protein
MTLSLQRSQVCPGQISRWAKQPEPAQLALLRPYARARRSRRRMHSHRLPQCYETALRLSSYSSPASPPQCRAASFRRGCSMRLNATRSVFWQQARRCHARPRYYVAYKIWRAAAPAAARHVGRAWLCDRGTWSAGRRRRHACYPYMQAPRVGERMAGDGRNLAARAPACEALPSGLLGLPEHERWEGNTAAACCNN